MKTNFFLLLLILKSIIGASAFALEGQHDTHVMAYRKLQLRNQQKSRNIMQCLDDSNLRTNIATFADLPNSVLFRMNSVLRNCALERDQAKWRARVAKIEKFFKKYDESEQTQDGFITLPTGGSIMSSGFDQEFYVFLMKKNPSKFKERKYCPPAYEGDPHGYREVIINGKTISMCPDFPVEQIAADSNGEKDSDTELIEEINRTYENAGLLTRFRRCKRAEYHFADTANGAHPKLSGEEHLIETGQYTPHYGISNQSPSKEHQPRSITENLPNIFGFRRSGVCEWVEDMRGIYRRRLVGGGWSYFPAGAASGNLNTGQPDRRRDDHGPARLVKMNDLK